MPSGSNVRLMLPERLVERRPEHLLHERAAHEAVAMLAGERAAELEHEVGDVVGERLERPHAFGGLHVDHGPHVQAADRRVGVDAGGGAVPADDREKPVDVVAQPFGRDRGVLDERDRLGVALSSPSTGRAPPRAGPRSWPAPADPARGGSDSRSRARDRSRSSASSRGGRSSARSA